MPNLLSPGSVVLQPQDMLSPYGLYGHMARGYSTPGSAVFTLANRIYYYPFRVPESWSITHVGTVNGTVANGNLDLGIYTPSGNRLGSTGTTAQSGTSAPQVIALTAAVQLFRGEWYYFGLTHSNTTGTFFRSTLTLALYARALGVLTEDAVGFGLPATATFAAAADAFAAVCGIAVTGLVL